MMLNLNTFPKTIIALILTLIIFAVLLAGCTTPRKAVDVLSRPKNEPVAAEFCATKYPVKDSLIQGDTVVNYDTLWGIEYRTDTLISEPQVITETKTVTVPKLVTKYVTVRDTIVRENTAKVSFLNSQIEKLSKSNISLTEKNAEISQDRDEYKESRNDWRLKFWILIAILVIYKAVKFRITKRLI